MNPQGGIALIQYDRATSFLADGTTRWSVTGAYVDGGTFSSDGQFYTAGIEEEQTSWPTRKWLHLNRFGQGGQLIAGRRIDRGTPESTSSAVVLDEIQRPWIFTQTLNDSESNPDSVSYFTAVDDSFNDRFNGGGSGGGGRVSVSLDQADNAYVTIGWNLKKYSPTGQVLWDLLYPLSLLQFVRFQNGLLFVSGYSDGICRILNSSGNQVGTWGSSFVGPKYDDHSFLATTQRPLAPNSVKKFSDSGQLIWSRALGDGTASYSGVTVIGRDKWGYIYVVVSDGNSEIVKLSPSGVILWRRRTVMERALVSPYNGDVFYVDFSATAIQHVYCLHQSPVGKPDIINAPSGTRVVYDVSQNDEYGVDAKYSITTPPAVGTATISPSGVLQYSAKAGFTGVVTLRYEAKKNGLNPASDVLVTITVQ